METGKPPCCCACVQGHVINEIPMTIGNTQTAAIISRSDNAFGQYKR